MDDEALNGELMRRVLNGKNFDNHVQTASNPYEALDLLRKHTFDIMLTDLLMPGLSGAELAIQVGAEYPRMIVMLVTGYDDAPEVIESLEYPDSPIIGVIM